MSFLTRNTFIQLYRNVKYFSLKTEICGHLRTSKGHFERDVVNIFKQITRIMISMIISCMIRKKYVFNIFVTLLLVLYKIFEEQECNIY